VQNHCAVHFPYHQQFGFLAVRQSSDQFAFVFIYLLMDCRTDVVYQDWLILINIVAA
jgi:hypothetical protein